MFSTPGKESQGVGQGEGLFNVSPIRILEESGNET